MSNLPFLDASRGPDNLFLLAITHATIVRSAVREGIIKDDDLASVPEVLPRIAQLAGALRDDLYTHFASIGETIQLPMVQNCFCYAFAKGCESAYLWDESAAGQFDLSYSFQDAQRGAAGARVSDEFAASITDNMQKAADVFVDFQNTILLDEKFGFKQGGRRPADIIACAFFSSSQVGLDAGMNHLGFP